MAEDDDDTDARHTLGRNVRRLAAERGKSLDAVADFAGIARRTLYNTLAGSHDPTLRSLIRIASALEVEPWELLRPE